MAGSRAQRPRLRVAVGDEALLDGPRDRVLEHPLDAAQQVGLVDADERDRLAGRAGPARPPDPVDVVLRVPRQLEVDDDRQVLDVEPAGGDVGRDEDPDLAGLEALERPRPFRLRSVGVDRHGVEALAVEPGGQPAGGQLRPGEDEHLAQVVLADEVGQQRFLAVAIDRVDELVDASSGRVPRRHLDRRRVAQDPARQAPDVVREGRREHQVLAPRREQGDDPLDVRQEAHVEHPVRLVEDEDLDLAEVGDPLADEVEQPARASRRGSRRRPAAP